MNKRNLISLLLVAVLLSTVFAGCGKGGDNPAQTTDTSAQSTTAQTSAQETTASGIDLGGYEFILYGYNGGEWTDNPQNALEEELVEQYRLVESELNCVITPVPQTSNELPELLTSGVSGDPLGDFVRCRQTAWVPAALKGIIRPLDSEEILNAGLNVFDPEVCDKTMTLMSEVNGHIWTITWAGKYLAHFGHGYAFNKKLLAASGYSDQDIYQAVRNFTWTWDYFVQICRDVSVDSDGDGTYDIEGLNMVHSGPELASNKYDSIYYDEAAGRWKAGISTPEYAEAVNYVVMLMTDADVSMADRDGLTNDLRRETFYDGRAAFAVLYSANFGENGVNNRMIDDYGFVPVPHGPAADKYVHIIPDLDSYCLQYANQNWEKSCKVMAALGEKIVSPDELQTRLAGYFRDSESLEMLMNYCYANAVFDIGKASPKFEDAFDTMVNRLFTAGPAVALEEGQSLMQTAINELFGY